MIKLQKTDLSDGGVHLLLNGLVDDKELRFVLDTGASHSVIDIKWARLNMSEDEIKLVDDPAHGIGAALEVHRAIVSSLKLGDLLLHNRSVALIDFSSINSVYATEGLEEIQGIIGGDLLNDFDAVIDYNKCELIFQSLIQNAV